MDRGAWSATIHGVTKSQTRLKRLSSHARIQHCKWYRVLMLISIVFQMHTHIPIIDKMTVLMVTEVPFISGLNDLWQSPLCPYTLTVSWQYPWMPCFLVSSRSIYKSSQFLPAVVKFVTCLFVLITGIPKESDLAEVLFEKCLQLRVDQAGPHYLLWSWLCVYFGSSVDFRAYLGHRILTYNLVEETDQWISE